MKNNGFGERLKRLLKQKSLTQVQVAAAIGISIPSVNRWTKSGEIEYENLRSLADFLEVNWVWLRYGDEAIESLQSVDSDKNTMKDLRREYLDQILQNEARMKAALEMAQIINWEWNALTGTVTCSENAPELFGVTADHFPNCMLPFTQLPLEELIDTFGSGKPHNWDYEVVDDEGQTKWFTSRAELIYDAANRPIKIIGISVDITDRKQAQKALERSEYKLKKIIEIIPVGLWVADEMGKIYLANPEVQRIWGGAKYVGLDQYGEYKGRWDKTNTELKPDDWSLARAVKNGETSSKEIVNIEAFDGQQRSIIMYATPLHDADNKIVGAIEINQDITETIRDEQNLKTLLEQWQAVFDQDEFGLIQLDDKLNIKTISKTLQSRIKPNKNNLKLTDLFDEATTHKILRELAELSIGELSSFNLSFINDMGKHQILYLIHDDRHKIVPMTLIILLNL